jgi:UDP-N-acetylmuramoyl-tripeptide--D-alanyl-D-alanine ligase
MIHMRLSEAVEPLQAMLHGADVDFSGCGTDTRTLNPGELFVALRGPRYDGHGFVADAVRRGAKAAILDHAVGAALPVLEVKDTRLAMGRLARLWRERFAIPLVAVTGSNGKTTVKEMVASILSGCGQVLATTGNLNNDIGVPLTLFRLGGEHRYAVVEMGANHPGEIASLCGMARPTVAVVTQCAPAHIEGFGSVEGVARAKGEVFEALGPDGVAVINADDDYAGLWLGLAGRRGTACRAPIQFGLKNPADITAADLDDGDPLQGSRFVLKTPGGSMEVRLPFPGRHNVMNALAAAASAHALGVELPAIVQGLESACPVHGRLELRKGGQGARILDDSYNANPGSLKAALELLAKCSGERWLVLGDMGELGPDAGDHHLRAGRMARESGVDRLYALGELSRRVVDGFGPAGRHFAGVDALLTAVRGDIHPGVTVLVKGSRSMRMERVVAALQQGDTPPCSSS